MQHVLAIYIEYLLYTTSTHSMHKVLTLYNECLPHTTNTYSSTYSIQQLHALCNEYLLYAMSTTLHYKYLLDTTSTYSIQRVLTIYNSSLL